MTTTDFLFRARLYSALFYASCLLLVAHSHRRTKITSSTELFLSALDHTVFTCALRVVNKDLSGPYLPVLTSTEYSKGRK